MAEDNELQRKIDTSNLESIWTRNPGKIIGFLLRQHEIPFKRIYISIPFQSDNPQITLNRMEAVKHYAFELMQKGLTPLTPIISGEAIFRQCNDGSVLGKASWQQYCFAHLELCNELHVILMGDTINSSQVIADIHRAKQLGIYVKYVPRGRSYESED